MLIEGNLTNADREQLKTNFTFIHNRESGDEFDGVSYEEGWNDLYAACIGIGNGELRARRRRACRSGPPRHAVRLSDLHPPARARHGRRAGLHGARLDGGG